MGEKALEVYQGSDWLTYRWTVAQAFDTLDRMRDLCRHSPEMLTPSAAHARAFAAALMTFSTRT